MSTPFKMLRLLFGLTILFVATSPARADLTIVGGARLLIRYGAVAKLNCGDITVGSGSRLDLGDGRIEDCRNFTLESGAFFTDGTGTLNLNGTWSNDGSYRRSAPERIRFTDACGQTNSVVGDGDADGDGRSDGVEGIRDTDGNGIPEFLDANTPPTISPIEDRIGPEDASIGPLTFYINDTDRPASALGVRVISSNQELIPNASIGLQGSDESRSLTLVPAADMSGQTTITVIVTDRWTSTTQTFNVTITAVNDTPVIVGQNDVFSFETTPVEITVADLEIQDPDNAYPEDFTLNIHDGENYLLSENIITAVDGFSGDLAVPVSVSDGNSQSEVYELTVYIATRKVVDNIDDNGPGSLRQIVATSGPGDVIDLSHVSGTVILTGGSLTISHDLSLTGPSTAPLVLDGNDGDRVLTIGADASVIIENLGITGGYSIQNGGGIANHGSLVLRNVAIYNNIAVDRTSFDGNGGGIDNRGSLTVINSTVSGNAADGNGGGIFSPDSAELFLTHCTLYGNAAHMNGGNLFNAGSLHMVNTIIAGSVAGGEWADSGTIATHTGNLVEDGSHGSRFSGDPLLGPLQDNGGPTVSHLPQTGSPALDAISPADCPVTADQRGFFRMENAGDAVDIGAVEVHYFQLTVQSTGDGSGIIRVDDTACGTGCSLPYAEGSPVTLEAVADDGFAFSGWSHPACADTEECTLILAADTTVQAAFEGIDSDGDGLSDAMELSGGTDPYNRDTDGDALADGTEDANRNGVIDPGETDPRQNNPGPGIPILIAPEDDSTDIEPMTLLEVDYASADSSQFHSQTRWQIGRDNAFETPLLDISTASHLLQATVPREVLEGNETYYWRVRFVGSDGLARMWSTTNRFSTRPQSYEDVNANHIPDDQEPPEGSDPFVQPTAEDGWNAELYYLDIVADDGSPIHVALQIDTRVTAMDFFGHTPSAQLTAAGDCPDDLVMGLFSLRLRLAETGGNTRIRLYFSTPLPEDWQWTKYDSLNGWQTYAGFTRISADRTMVTIDLVDGGFGDADGVANGIVVDPSGPTVPAATDPVPSSSGGDGGGGCFIGTLW